MKNIAYILGFAMFLQSCSSDKPNKKIEGKIEREQLAVTTKIPGKIQQILVEEGQFVKKGDTLLILELPEVEAKAAQAQGALESAQAQYEMAVKGATDGQLKQLHAKVNGLKEQYEYAEKSLNRMRNLLQDSLVSQQKYDEVYAKYQGAKNQYLAAQAEVADVTNGARIEQQKMALGQKERALGAVSEVNVAANEKYIIAPQDMSIETINLKVGELALAGYSLASGYIADETYFRVTIPESKVKEFQKGEIKTLAFPYLDNKQLQAKVETIKTLTSYANISTAYPDFEQQETMFEIRLKPVNVAEAKDLLTKATFIVVETK
ncbi:HlyD family secretion protein [Sphingobacterium alimentarium]|uniref:HlyD family secretion protein n=1 Tax=Sphingobacterium alimentarium TaxID=797292 RepID=A0A4V6P326_9SPHI|nr:biotin/lipoyl-binding protein [Sphingobacterium alimentarium]TCV20005.1 HlyD family secretion protein [Sphingobacterium alimentarium]